MTLISFLIFFILFSLVASVATNGEFLASRPNEETRPDGKLLKNGKILQWWYYFWHQQETPEKVFYQGKQLRCLMGNLKSYVTGPIELHGEARLIVTQGFVDKEFDLSNQLDICFNFEKQDNGLYMVTIYKEYECYVFPEWLRDMTSGCITCHATIYGNIAFWIMTCLCREDLYAWSTNSFWALIATWIAFWFCQAYLNTWLYQRIKH